MNEKMSPLPLPQSKKSTKTVIPVIDRTFPLAQVPEAIRYLESGQALGKIVITIDP